MTLGPALGPRSWSAFLALYLGSHSWPLPLVKPVSFRASLLLLVLSVLAFAHSLLASAPTPCLAGNHSQRLLLGVFYAAFLCCVSMLRFYVTFLCDVSMWRFRLTLLFGVPVWCVDNAFADGVISPTGRASQKTTPQKTTPLRLYFIDKLSMLFEIGKKPFLL